MSYTSMPLIGVTGDTLYETDSDFYKVGDKYILSVVEAANCLAVMIPPIAEKLNIDLLLDRLDGVVFTGSPANIDPHHYGVESQQRPDQLDPGRDSTNLPLLEKVISRGMPFMCICRGHQELNVVRGGTLHQFVHEIDGRHDHRSDKTIPYDERYGDIHSINLTPDGFLSQLNEGNNKVFINSLHEQAVDKLGDGLKVEATAEDGTIEAISLNDYPNFMISVQWHPEHSRALELPLNQKLFTEFGQAAQEWHIKKSAITS